MEMRITEGNSFIIKPIVHMITTRYSRHSYDLLYEIVMSVFYKKKPFGGLPQLIQKGHSLRQMAE